MLEAEQRELLEVLAYFYLQQARPERAATLYGALAALYPSDKRLQLALACAQTRAGQSEAALDSLDRLLEDGQIDAGIHLLRAQALTRLGRDSEAARAMDSFIALR
ncbi:type III secretion apparatus assembly chaperone SctY [Chitinimonas lacunae]|uniref:Tetratricopeptide repeat protein n=1 Tax=Chitinimonas lacunae TaxID=1963018 RepID=A0ABV8MPD8_9NEIS